MCVLQMRDKRGKADRCFAMAATLVAMLFRKTHPIKCRMRIKPGKKLRTKNDDRKKREKNRNENEKPFPISKEIFSLFSRLFFSSLFSCLIRINLRQNKIKEKEEFQ